MANKAAAECTDQLCKRIKKNNEPFSGIPFIALGDFRQVAPVVKGEGQTTAILASVKSSYIWPSFEIQTLNTPIRGTDNLEYTSFVDNVGEDYIHPTVSLSILHHIHSIDDVISFLYPNSILNQPALCLKRALLSPQNIFVDKFNERILNIIPGEEGTSYYYKTTSSN